MPHLSLATGTFFSKMAKKLTCPRKVLRRTFYAMCKLLLEIAYGLSKKEASLLVYLSRKHLNHRGFVLSKMKADKMASSLKIFLILEQSGWMSSGDLSLIAGLLNEIGRPDLCQKVQTYQDFYPNTSYDTEGVMQMDIELVIPPEPPKLPEYKMNARPRGYCLIINNVTFYKMRDDPNSHELENREGSHIDANDLTGVFRDLGFLVEVKKDQTDTEMVRVTTEISLRDHSDFDCFVCCILTHGGHGYLYGCNGNLCQISEITSCFKAQRCPGLRGKPKMFFLQACQGKQKQNGFLKGIEMDANEQSVETIPDEADFLLGYATVPGFVSYRSKTHGSWYITKLCENLRNFGLMYDLLSILTKVNEEVSMCSDGQFKQVPAPMHTLRKRIHFR